MTDVDLLVIGGGIAGAGVALEASRRGVDVMLVEARDFAWGSSSRSSKLVHGGLRYLREGAFGLTRESVRERGRLLQDAPGLVEPQRFLLGHYEGRSPSRRTMAAGLAIYDAMAHQRTRAFHTPAQVRALAPHMATDQLLGASSYLDAKTDDSRLVMRVLQEAQRHGARVCNRAAVKSLLRAGDLDVPSSSLLNRGGASVKPGTVVGARIEGAGFTGHVQARCVVNATGFWADGLRSGLGATMLRPLRGSHLVFPLWKLPVAQSVSLLHPRDGRPVFATPWEGVALAGTTDLDHHEDPDVEPRIAADEVAYLIEALRHAFPRLDLRAADAVCSFAGVRPVVDDRAGGDPSKAPREHVVLDEQGLITVTGGKLTTFRVNALDALRHAAPYLAASGRRGGFAPTGIAGDEAGSDATMRTHDFDYRTADAIFAPQPESPALAALPHGLRTRLLGRYGHQAQALLREAAPADLETVAGTTTPWAELHWALRHEQVRFLDDLLLRRTRLGLLLPAGAASLLPRLEPVAREALGWSAGEWRDQCDRYARIVAQCYTVPTP